MKKIILLFGVLLCLAQVKAQLPGVIMAYGGTKESLTRLEAQGWLVCDGRILNRADARYRALFNAIGTSWGVMAVTALPCPTCAASSSAACPAVPATTPIRLPARNRAPT